MKYGISGRMYSTWNKVFLVHCAVIIYNEEQLQPGVDKCHIFLILVVFLSAQSSTVSMARGYNNKNLLARYICLHLLYKHDILINRNFLCKAHPGVICQ